MSKVDDWKARVKQTEAQLGIAEKANKDGKFNAVVNRLKATLKRQKETLKTYEQQVELFGE